MKELTINHSEVVKIKLTSMMNNKLFWPLFALALLLLFNLVNDPSFFHIEIKNGGRSRH